MKKMKRVLALLLVMICCFTMLVGCGTSDSSSKATTASKEDKDYSIEVTDDIQAIKDTGYLTVGVKTDVPGFGYYDKETKEYSGIEIDLSYQIAAKIFDTTEEKAKEDGLVHFVKATVANRSTLLVENTVDLVIATFTITDERKETFAFSDSYYTDHIGIMVKKDTADEASLGSSAITSVQKLDGKKLGVALNSDTRADMLSYFKSRDYDVTPRFVEMSTYTELYKALKNGDIDAFAVDASILNGYLDDDLTILPDRFAAQNYGVAANKDNQGLIDAVNVVIEEQEY